MKISASQKRQIRRLAASILGLSVVAGAVANADSVSDFFPTILATQENASLAMIADPTVFGILGALGFFVLATMRRNRP